MNKEIWFKEGKMVEKITIPLDETPEYKTLEEASKSLPPCPPGYEYCWVRYEFASIKDVENIVNVEGRGWKPVIPIRKFKGLIAAIRRVPLSIGALEKNFERDMKYLWNNNASEDKVRIGDNHEK